MVRKDAHIAHLLDRLVELPSAPKTPEIDRLLQYANLLCPIVSRLFVVQAILDEIACQNRIYADQQGRLARTVQ